MKYTFYIAFIISVSLLFTTQGFSQPFSPSDFQKGVALDFSIIDEKRIEKGIKLINEAYEIEKEAILAIEAIAEDEKLKQTVPGYKKAVKRLVQASESYREGFMILYTVFQENSIKFKDTQRKINHYAAGVNKAKFYERKASKAYSRALSIRDLLLEMEKFDLIQYKMAEALELEKLSIRDRGRALQIYQDFPVEYDYGWEDDVTEEQVNAAFKDPAISRPPDDLFVQAKKAAVTEDAPEKPAEAPIVFHVQIAAHTVKMSDEYIEEHIYQGSEPVTEIFEDNWYKYIIGRYDNFNDAKELLIASRVRKAFVVAYQGGKRLTIKQALAKIKQNQ
jgi:hypothetical protein